MEMFKFGSIIRPAWKPHFLDEALFVEMFKFGNIT